MTRDTRTPDRPAAPGASPAPTRPAPQIRLPLPAAEHRVAAVAGADGTPLALHSWRPAEPTEAAEVTTLLFYVHGIQSHAGWLFETGPELTQHGTVTYAADRRGSGRSGGMRGDLPAAGVVLEDYRTVLAQARRDWPGLPVVALGQSFGGSILAALVAQGLEVDRLIYCAPALGQQRARHGTERLAELAALTGTEHSAIALADEDYTDLARYLEFMANDRLMLRQVTARSRATMVELERTYLERRADTAAPVHLVRAEHDPIIALAESERVLTTLHEKVDVATFRGRHHYVEFSRARRDYWHWLAATVAGRDR
ncbi:MAG TPA: alpha/beta fold hydrolase [Jatrophihabitans sp.]|uniref:alpha/beta hydrolase n=1 Tax=Jatrophihabitans sp. TaxID=1932789 RepID=UPI002F032FD9